MTPAKSDQLHQFIVRPAELQDAKEIWLWRNDEATRSNSITSAPIPWAEHTDWLERVLEDPGQVIYMAVSAPIEPAERSESIAVVRYDRLSSEVECWRVGLNLRPESRGFGFGRLVLHAACSRFFDTHGLHILQAEIHPQNIPSQRVFLALGFVLTNRPGGNSFDLYRRPAAPLPKSPALRGG